MINFINKTVEIVAHILYNKGQAKNKRFRLPFPVT